MDIFRRLYNQILDNLHLSSRPPMLTWSCESCGRIRPDDKIKVYSFPIPELPGAVRNWRYCSDRLSCRTFAYTEAPKGPFTVIKRVQANGSKQSL